MYHVSTDTSFVYRVCGGQQDSGSACVDSRSMDGEITFHDWHPVNIQEYGIAAPDPKDPDKVFGSMRTNVSLFNRKTGQITTVGPDATERGDEVQSQRAHDADQLVAGRSERAVLHLERRVEDDRSRTSAGRASAPISRGRRWAVPANAGQIREHGHPRRRARSPRSRRRRGASACSGPAPTTATSR